jgi:ABC-2 type transport system permease protein
MLSASFYIVICSARNRLRVRLRRLREPRYLVGAIVGVAYIYFSFFARFRASRAAAARRRGRPGQGQLPAALTTLMASGPALGGLALMAVAAASWALPFDSGLLEFSDPEVQFLFPAPVSRRSLLVHRMLRSQLGMLFSAMVIGVASGASLSGYARLRLSVASWLLLVTARIYFTGVTLARVRLGSRDARSRRVAWLPIGVMTAALAAVGVALARAYAQAPPTGVLDTLALVGPASQTGVAAVVLWPFMALTRPLFAAWPQPYLVALGGAALVLTAMGVWVLKSDEAFQEAAAGVLERRGQETAKKGASTYRVGSTGWTLAPLGRPETAFAWKAAMQTLRTVDKRTLARIAAILVALTMVAVSMGRANGFASVLGVFSLVGTLFAILMAPQVIRIDLRQDLQHLELLKTWPVKAAAVVRGELLWPGVVISAGAWTMLTVAMFLSGTVLTHVTLGLRLAGGAAIAIVAPSLVFAQLTIHNAVALAFPAWVPLGNQRPRGLDAMGQRLIMLGGTWLLLVLAALPGAVAAGIVWFALAYFIGSAALVPAAVVCASILAMEVLLATEALGPAYERLDVTAVERAE